MTQDRYLPDRRATLAAVGAGVAYGLLARLVFSWAAWSSWLGTMTVSFLFLMPWSLGFLTVRLAERRARLPWMRRVLLPWPASLIALGSALLLAWEGLICVVLWVPLFLVMGTLGGVVAGIYADLVAGPRSRSYSLACCVVAPFLVAPLEHRLPTPNETRRVETSIAIAAEPAVVWSQIKRVPAIRPEEQRVSYSQWIGFPRPIEATLSAERVGGVRRASFAGDVVFWETVTDWEPERRLAFTIKADTDSIPAASLDEHVRVGGPHFDVLRGEYRIKAAGPGYVVLHLASDHRLSTRFNGYAGLWTEFIMRDVQVNILHVIRNRCEEFARSTQRARGVR